jgi:hypothetical protein
MEGCKQAVYERPLFFPKEDMCPELAEMRNEVLMTDVPTASQLQQQTISNGRELYNILITYLLEFWRHEVEIRKPNNFFSTVTGFAGEGNWWDMVDDEAPENGGRKKTRWQEVAETLWTQLLRLDAYDEEFDPENARHLKGLAKIFERGDETLKTIVRNYLSALS